VKLRIVAKEKLKPSSEPFVVLLDNGDELSAVTAVRFSADFESVPQATVEMILTEADLECDADVFVTVLPNGKRYKLVEVDDG
jgi:hypothetical protein